MQSTTKIFIHGLESSNKGTKALFFRQRYPEMIVPDFTGDLNERMKKLTAILGDRQDLLVIGSSFGGLMGALFTLKYPQRVRKLILLAPALCFRAFRLPNSKTIDVPVIIYHGNKDDVVPLEPVRGIARKVFSNMIFHAVEDDHLLHKTFQGIDWADLLH